MANLTNYAEKAMLDHTLGKTALTMPNPAYLAAFRASPGETGSLSSEPSGNNYSRVSLASASPDNHKMAATVLATGKCVNDETITFPTPSGDGWGTITHLGVCDAATAGNVLLYLKLFSAVFQPASASPITLVPGALQIFGIIDNPNGLTQYGAKKWLDHLLGIASFTQPTDTYLAMFSADPTSAGSLTNEIATGSYGRQIITDAMTATELETGISINEDGVVFPDPDDNYSVTHYGVMDAVSSGNMILRKARGSTLQVISGAAAVQINAGQIAIRAA